MPRDQILTEVLSKIFKCYWLQVVSPQGYGCGDFVAKPMGYLRQPGLHLAMWRVPLLGLTTLLRGLECASLLNGLGQHVPFWSALLRATWE